MIALIDTAFRYARTTLSILALLLLAGFMSYQSIPKEAEPDVNLPNVYVVLTHEGISPEDAERLLLRPMEHELSGIEGLKEMRSTAKEGTGTIFLEFEAGFDADLALADVREKVDLAKPDLPDATEEPTIHEVNVSLFPILVVMLSGDVPERTLYRLADELQKSIEGIDTVLEAKIAGDREDMVEVLIDPARVESYGLGMQDAINAVAASNKLVAAGTQDTGQGRFAVKVPGLYKSLPDIMNQPVKADGDAVARLIDVAEVRRTFKDAESFARLDGRPAVALEVTKRVGTNIIETIEKVRAQVAAEQATWPQGMQDSVHVDFIQDKSNKVRNMLNDLQNNVLAAVLLVMIVVVAALGARTAGLVGIAIPGSFLTAILVLSVLGFTVNIVVLFSLILAVGMLVDGAIVVTEYADRKMTEGEHRSVAYGLAAKRMSWPIIASTATTLAAFLPLVFWPGVVGEFMKYLPMTLLITLTASLAMALVFVPTLGSFLGRPGTADVQAMKALGGGAHDDPERIGGFTGRYVHVLKSALAHPGKILAGAVALLVLVQMAYGLFGKGVEFFPDVEPEFAKLEVRAQGNLSIHEKDALMTAVESRILDMAEFKTIYARTGADERSEEAEDIIGTINLEFIDWRERRTAHDILEDVLARTADMPGFSVDIRKEEAGPPTGKPVQIELATRFPDLLGGEAAKVAAQFHRMEGLRNIEDGVPPPGIDWQLQVDRTQAAKFGLSIDQVGQAVRLATTGVNLGEYRPDDVDDEVDIRARYPEAWRTVDQFDHIRIATGNGDVPVPLSNFVERTAKPAVGTVHRTDGRRVMTVRADIEDGILADDKVQELQAWLKANPIDERVETIFKGENEEQQKAQAFLGKAFGVALFIMAIILVTQFNSFYSAFLILFAVVMSTLGVLIGLLVTGQPFGIVMSGIGVIALAGIVVNNNIVLIDTFDRLRDDGHAVYDAILRTGAQRLRPVLLTSVTTILGLMPMVLSVNVDFLAREVTMGAPAMQWWGQLATAIAFGLAFATVLTLIVTPCALMLRENLGDWWRKKYQAAA